MNSLYVMHQQAQPKSLMKQRDRLVDMLAFSGHELNNTLTRLVLNIESLMRDTNLVLTEQQQHTIESVAQNARLLKSIAHSYMVLARLEDELLELNATSLDPVSAIIEPLVTTYTQIMVEQHQTCEIRSYCSGVQICADATLLTSAFDNLLNNAIKYGVPGSKILITANQNGSNFEFHFRNHSREINPEVFNQMFDRFVRGPNTKNQHGNGIGLYVVKRSVEVHGGSVEVKTTLQGEVEFTVSLPILDA